MEGALKRRGVKKLEIVKNKINKIQKLCVINAILQRYKIKYFKGTNFYDGDFLALLREIFVQLLIFMNFTNCYLTGIFSINDTPSARWRLFEGGP